MAAAAVAHDSPADLVAVEPLSPATPATSTTTASSAPFDFDPDSSSALLSPLAKRIPQAKRTKDLDEYKQRDMERKCLIKCVDWLVKNESIATVMWNHIMTGQLAVNNGRPEADWFKDAPKTMARVDLKWRAQFLQDLSEGALTTEVIRRLDARDENALHDIWCMVTKTTGTEMLSPAFQEKALLAVAVRLRVQQVGGPSLRQWIRDHLNVETGVVDWLRGGAYSYEFQENRLKRVVHRSGSAADVPEFINIRRDFTLESPAVDTLTKFSKKPFDLIIRTLFAKDQGPNAHTFDRKGRAMKAWVEDATAALRRQQALARAGTTSNPDLVLTDHAKERRVAALVRARAKADAQPVSKRARKLSMPVA